MNLITDPNDVTPEMRDAFANGLGALGSMLRRWRAYGYLHSLTAEWRSGDDAPVLVRCAEDDVITVVFADGTAVDASEFVTTWDEQTEASP